MKNQPTHHPYELWIDILSLQNLGGIQSVGHKKKLSAISTEWSFKDTWMYICKCNQLADIFQCKRNHSRYTKEEENLRDCVLMGGYGGGF